MSVGSGAVIGSGAVVTRDVAPFAIVVGVPARPIRYRFSGPVMEQLLELGWWHWSHEKLTAALPDIRNLQVEAFWRSTPERDCYPLIDTVSGFTVFPAFPPGSTS